METEQMSTEDVLSDTTRILHIHSHKTGRFTSLAVPVHRSSTVLFRNMESLRQKYADKGEAWAYGLQENPTQQELANKLAYIEGGKYALLMPSGLAAISLVQLSLLHSGDELLLPDNVYEPNRYHAEWLAENFAIRVRFYDPGQVAKLEKMLTAKTKLIWLEAPGSITMEIPDIPAITALARKHKVISVLDHTWSGGILCRPFALGVDISVQALTKYQSGGNDVLMGSVVVRDRELHQRLQITRQSMGCNVSSDDCYFILRNLSSLNVRIAAHGERALALANWLTTRPEVVRVLHPALPDCPGHSYWQRDFSGASGLFSVVFHKRYRQAQIDAFIEDLQLFALGYGWGGERSLVMYYQVEDQRSVTTWPPENLPDYEQMGSLVRFYCGFEDPHDLIADVQQSIERHLV